MGAYMYQRDDWRHRFYMRAYHLYTDHASFNRVHFKAPALKGSLGGKIIVTQLTIEFN
jgi:hypothetical protein